MHCTQQGFGKVGVSSKAPEKEKWVRNPGGVGWLARFTGGGTQERLGFSLEQSHKTVR